MLTNEQVRTVLGRSYIGCEAPTKDTARWALEEVLRVREELASWELGLQTAEESIVALQLERDALRTAMTAALRELGVPTSSYPAPVANAVEILEAALEGVSDE